MSCGGISFPANCVTINGTLTNAFSTIAVPNGTNPVAEVYNDTLALTSSDSTITITGNSTTDTIDFIAREASSLVSGIVSTGNQTFAGRKTFADSVVLSANLNYAWTQDAAATGANAELTNHPTICVEVTNASLTSVAKLDATSLSAGHMIIVRNKTGAAITIVDQVDVSGEQIVTGTGANVTLANNASIAFMRDRTNLFWAVVGVSSGVTAHNQLTGLSADDHTQYALLAGRSGGQSLTGGTGSGDDLTLLSTSHGTKGTIFLGTASAYDQVNDRLGLGITAPTVKFHQDGGNATATYHKFTAGSTTGTTSTDGFDVGIDSSGNGEIRQRENLPITFYANNSSVMRVAGSVGTLENGRVVVGDVSESSFFFPTVEQKFLVNNNMTTLGTSGSPGSFDLIKLLAVTSADATPSGDTNSGLGFTIYGGQGFTINARGSNNFNGGLPVGGSQNSTVATETTSVLGAFGQAQIYTTGDIDGLTGLLCTAAHISYEASGVTSYMLGGDFSVLSDGSAGPTLAGGSITKMVGGRFTAWVSGAPCTTAIAGDFYEPAAYDSFSGVGLPADPTNRTAISCRGTLSILESTVASASSITNMTVATSFVYLTGSTATTLHGIHSDSFCKILCLVNQTGSNLTIKHDSATDGTASNRIYTATGADVVSTGNSRHLFIWSPTASRWILIGGDL